uniref:DUF7453 family protein n=1 Tax=Posidoniimonas polymericola TaxID=2528002 RepID=UPI0011B3C985|nr:choice-of-anchor tandem repeat NxxGxxAF-containing protein [Posidoniimonas polymericola]
MIAGYEARGVGGRLLGADGQVAFGVGLVDSSDNVRWSLWRSDRQHAEVVAVTGEPAPGTDDGSVYSYLPAHRFVPDGTLYFTSDLLPSSDGRTFGLFAHAAGGTASLQARSTGVYSLDWSINQLGRSAVRANDGSIYYYDHLSTTPSLVFEAGYTEPAFGLASLSLFGGQLVLNDQGVLLSEGSIGYTYGTADYYDSGFWTVDRAGKVTEIAREGSPAPGYGPGHVFGPLGLNKWQRGAADMNSSGEVAFIGDVYSTAPPAFGGVDVWVTGPDGQLRSIASWGDSLPGAEGITLGYPYPPTISDSGVVVFAADLETGDRDRDSGIFKGASREDLAVVAVEGQQAPGLPPCAVLGDFGEWGWSGQWATFEANASGRVAFHCFVVNDSGFDLGPEPSGIWAENLQGDLQLIAHTGESLDVNPDPAITDERVIERLSPFGNDLFATSSQKYFNDRGQILFTATFTDGTSGVFVSNLVAVPEPAGLALALAAAGLLWRPRRRSSGRQT